MLSPEDVDPEIVANALEAMETTAPINYQAMELEDIARIILASASEGLGRDLVRLLAEAEEYRQDAQRTCVLVADMHKAAVGEVRGPIRGVVEDVEDVRAARQQAEQQLALLHEGEEPPPAEKGVSLSPAQMIWRWNRATPAARLAVATQLRNASDQLGRYEWALRNIANLCTCTGPSNCASSVARSALAGPEPAVRCSDNPTCNGGCCAKPEDAPGPRMDQRCANCPHLRGDHADNIVSNPCLASYIAAPCDCRSFTGASA